MSSINYYIDRPNRKKECPIYLVYENNGQKFKYFTKQKIIAALWSQKSQKVKSGSAAEDINLLLSDYKELIRQIERKAMINSIPITAEYVKDKLINTINPPAKAEEVETTNLTEFDTCFKKYIETSKTSKVSGTVRQIEVSYKKFKDFEKEYNYKLTFHSINQVFYQKVQEYFVNDLKFLNNTNGINIKVLKSFLNWCTDMGYNTNLAFKKFKVYKEDIEIIYLTETELLKLYNLDIPAELFKEQTNNQATEINPNKISAEILSNVRDAFCFACFTGLRYSDISNLKPDQIKSDHLLVRTEKTKDMLIIPLINYARQILIKHSTDGVNSLPHIIYNQLMNVYVKEVCKLAGIDEMTRTVSYSGSKKTESLRPKYKLITFHSARRTFVTLSLEKGMRAEVVMQISGHKDYRTFKKYIKITDKVKTEELNRIWN